ncbi:hypothetical protein [Streptomyces sp. ITFR-6]|uniref:hypothetical protein n=1 Tax=Streptomyces sp. ITFR-6 TaxID=3075197 RepID=UPI00288AA883|nr:hypothetical protein [Streptomyces sp. ITFR-6]WNI30135.1 hypothetical protein RLT59_16030 [Streptomyces sp. ITFR-6]
MPAVLVLLLSGTWLLSGALVTGTDPLIVAVGRTAVCCLVLSAVAASSRSGRADLRRAADRPGTVWLLGLLGFAGYAAGTLPALIAHPPTLAATGGIVVLGAVVYAPAYLVQHRLILLRGPVFTAAVQLAVPFTVRLGDWALDTAPAPSLPEVLLLAACCAGIALVTVQPVRPPEPVASQR